MLDEREQVAADVDATPYLRVITNENCAVRTAGPFIPKKREPLRNRAANAPAEQTRGCLSISFSPAVPVPFASK